MSTFDISDKIETQISQLQRARAVLMEVDNYFIHGDVAESLPYHADHILLLLHTADYLLYGMLPELTTVVELLAHHKGAGVDETGKDE